MPKEFPKLTKACESVTKYSIYLLVFLLPLFFLPWTSDVLDFNKQALLVVLSFIALFGWMAKVLISGKFKINSSKLNFAVLTLFATVTLSAIFSQDKYGSFWGWPRSTGESLLTIISLLVVYFLASSFFSKKEVLKSVSILMPSSLLAILIGIFQLFGIYLPFDFAKSPSFNTIGMVGALGLFIAILLPLLMILAIYSKKWLRITFSIGIVLSAIVLVLINYTIVWWMVLIGCSLLVLFAALKRDIFDLRWLGMPMFFLVLALFFIVLTVQLPVQNRPVEVYLTQATGFDIAIKALKQSPILGSGPGTFAYDFSMFKGKDLNQNALWNIKFGNAGSKVLTLMATVGILGLVSFLTLLGILLFYGIKFLIKNRPTEGDEGVLTYVIAGGIFIALLAQICIYFFYNSNLVLDFIFFLLAGCFISLTASNKKEFKLNPSSFLTLGVTFAFTLFFIFGLGLLILNGQRYIAEVNYASGISAFASGDLDKGVQKIEKAVSLNPKSDIYLSQLSQAYLLKLTQVLNDKDLSDEERNIVSQLLVNNSINAAKMTTDVSPKNVSNWALRGSIFQNLVGLVSESENWVVSSYEEAMKLDPTNPFYPTQQGIGYMAKASIEGKDNNQKKEENLAKAKTLFEKAIELKSDYAPARFQISMIYKARGETQQEISTLEEAKTFSPNDIGLLFQLGLIYYQEGNYEKAKQNLELSVGLSPNYANALYFLGLTYNKLGQNSKAISQFEKIAQSNPDNEEIKKILENLNANRNPLVGISEDDPPQVPVEESPEEAPNT